MVVTVVRETFVAPHSLDPFLYLIAAPARVLIAQNTFHSYVVAMDNPVSSLYLALLAPQLIGQEYIKLNQITALLRVVIITEQTFV